MVELTTRDKVRRSAIALAVVACVAGLGIAIASTREVDSSGETVIDRGDPCEVEISGEAPEVPECNPSDEALGDIVEQLFPARDSEVLRQAQVGIDLGSAYTGTLVVDGVEVPEDQLVRQAQLNQVFFAPGDGYVLEEWPPGRNCIQAIVWPIVEGPSERRTIDWCFEVT